MIHPDTDNSPFMYAHTHTHIIHTHNHTHTYQIMSTIFQGEAMLKAMNVMMLKVLENCDKTLAYIALLQLLRAPPPSVATKGPDAAARFSDLIVKCLIKLTKTLPVCIDTLDVDQLLCSIHEYFTELGLDEIRKRGSSEDKPLRMMKTLLHELCKHLVGFGGEGGGGEGMGGDGHVCMDGCMIWYAYVCIRMICICALYHICRHTHHLPILYTHAYINPLTQTHPSSLHPLPPSTTPSHNTHTQTPTGFCYS